MNGVEVARRVLNRRPDLPMVFARGYSESAALDEVSGARSRALRKPLLHELQIALSELLASSAD